MASEGMTANCLTIVICVVLGLDTGRQGFGLLEELAHRRQATASHVPAQHGQGFEKSGAWLRAVAARRMTMNSSLVPRDFSQKPLRAMASRRRGENRGAGHPTTLE